MARQSTADDGGASWQSDRVEIDKFIVAASGSTLRKFDGSYDDAQDLLDWVISAGWEGEAMDAGHDDKTLRLTHPHSDSEVALGKGQYLVLREGVFSVKWPAYAEGDVVDEFGQL